MVCRSICSCIPDSHPYRISSEETTVLMRHLVLVILCGWLSGMQGGIYKIIQGCSSTKHKNTKFYLTSSIKIRCCIGDDSDCT